MDGVGGEWGGVEEVFSQPLETGGREFFSKRGGAISLSPLPPGALPSSTGLQ